MIYEITNKMSKNNEWAQVNDSIIAAIAQNKYSILITMSIINKKTNNTYKLIN